MQTVSMKPISFFRKAAFPLAPEDITRQILDVSHWPNFTGFGLIPRIRTAEFEVRTLCIVGSRIRVTNTDGSSHVEEIAEWQPDHRPRLRMQDFSAPLSRLATVFNETWEFRRTGDAIKVTRSFELHAKSAAAMSLLSLISVFLKRAIARHLRQMVVA
jgi:hypothetical protein